MKRLLIAFAATALFASCEKQQEVAPAPPAQGKSISSVSRIPPQPTRPRYCYGSVQTSSDSWTLTVYQNLGGSTASPGTTYIRYNTNGVSSGWLGASFPYTLYSGSAGVVSNIQVKESVCYVGQDRNGNPIDICNDTIYDVNLCP